MAETQQQLWKGVTQSARKRLQDAKLWHTKVVWTAVGGEKGSSDGILQSCVKCAVHVSDRPVTMQQALRRGPSPSAHARLTQLAGRRGPRIRVAHPLGCSRRFAAYACADRGPRAHVPYEDTSGGVKAVVAGLTRALNALAGVDAQAAEHAAEELARGDTRPPLDPQEGESEARSHAEVNSLSSIDALSASASLPCECE